MPRGHYITLRIVSIDRNDVPDEMLSGKNMVRRIWYEESRVSRTSALHGGYRRISTVVVCGQWAYG